jgi:hypothetical protein
MMKTLVGQSMALRRKLNADDFRRFELTSATRQLMQINNAYQFNIADLATVDRKCFGPHTRQKIY